MSYALTMRMRFKFLFCAVFAFALVTVVSAFSQVAASQYGEPLDKTGTISLSVFVVSIIAVCGTMMAFTGTFLWMIYTLRSHTRILENLKCLNAADRAGCIDK